MKIRGLVESISNFETDPHSACIAVTLLEKQVIPKEDVPQARDSLRGFILAALASGKPADAAFRAAFRKLIFLQDRGCFHTIEWLIDALSDRDTRNVMEVVKTLTDFFYYDPPAPLIRPNRLIDFLSNQCDTCLKNDLLSIPYHRIITVDSLLCLVFLAADEARPLMERAARLSPGFGRFMRRRYLEIEELLDDKGVTNRASIELIRYGLGK